MTQLSTRSCYPGCQELERLRAMNVQPVVYLDGVNVTSDAIAADDQAGTVVCVMRDRDGKLRVMDDYSDVMMETRRGRVKIELPVVHEAVAALGGRR